MKKTKNSRAVLAKKQNNVRWRLKTITFFSLLLLLFSFSAIAATSASNYKLIDANYVQQQVSGTVTDDTGTPLPGASIVVEGTSNGTQTDFDGNYTISADSEATLVISYIGFLPKEIIVGNQTSINVQLDIDNNLLDEVVVVGYGTQSRVEVTGAIATIDTEELTAIPVSTAEQALQGRAAGVTVLNTGSPGEAPVVRIRGLGTMNDNEPLYVIDGVISSGLGSLNPNDIESINILKDASTTAIYGSLGSNGVVMVTTKRGESGDKVKVTLDAYTGVQYNSERYDVLNTEQYLQYANDAFGFVPTSALSSSGNNTNWQDAIFRSGIMQNVDLGISGGNENSNFRFSAGYVDLEGAVIETGFERFTFRVNSNFNVGKFKFGESLSVSFNKQDPERSRGGRSLIEHAIKSAPYLPTHNANNLGGFQGPNTSADGQDAENPVRAQTLGHEINKSTTVLGSVYGEYEIFKGLKFKSQAGVEMISFNFNGFVPSYNDDSEGATHNQGFALTTKNSSETKTIVLTNSLNYNTSFNDVHNVEVLLVAEKYDSSFDRLNSSSQNPITDEIEQVSSTQDQAFLQSFSAEVNRVGYLGRINYNYAQKYLIAASFRRDASSKFGKNNRWGNFPSVAVGWNIAKEDFMENTNFNTFKLRGSWGVVGNDKIGNYRFSSTLLPNFIYPINGEGAVGTTAGGLANPDLKWEETTMTNIGLDIGWMNNKFTASFEYFSNTSDDLLMNLPLPLSSGFHVNQFPINIGSVETNGFEMSLGYNDTEGDFTWSANVNIGTSTNEVISLGGVESLNGGAFEGSNIARITEGEPLFYFFGLQTDGIYQTQAEVDAVFTADPAQTTVQPGDIRFVDQNGDGAITADDRVKIGNPYPDFTYGVNLNAGYKGWDLNMFITGVSGLDVYNTNIYDLEGMPRLFNAGVGVLNRWTGPGTSNTVPRAGGAPQNLAISDRFVEDGSFARLKNITLGHTINNKMLGDYISRLKIYISGQNLITLSDYSGLDPEIAASTANGNVANQFELGIDRGNYPQPKSVLLGIQVSF